MRRVSSCANLNRPLLSLAPGRNVFPGLLATADSQATWVGAIALLAVIVAVIAFVPNRSHYASAASRPPSRETQDLYLKGRYYWNKRTADDLNKSVDYFTQAIVKDPGYAAAYVGLADAYNLLSEFSVMPYRDAFTRAIAAAKKAVELDNNSAEAHNALAFASFYGAWDPVTAELEFRRALELKPNYAIAHHWYATCLIALGRSREGLDEIQKAQELEPASTSILADEGLILVNSHQRVRGIALLKQIETSEPSFLSTHRYLAEIYLANKDYPAYLRETKTTAALSHDPAAGAIAEAGAKGYAAGRERGMLLAMLKVQETWASSARPRYYSVALTCLLLDDRAKAIRYLNAAFDSRDPAMLSLRGDPRFDDLHNEAAFQSLIARMQAAQL